MVSNIYRNKCTKTVKPRGISGSPLSQGSCITMWSVLTLIHGRLWLRIYILTLRAATKMKEKENGGQEEE